MLDFSTVVYSSNILNTYLKSKLLLGTKNFLIEFSIKISRRLNKVFSNYCDKRLFPSNYHQIMEYLYIKHRGKPCRQMIIFDVFIV